MYNFDEIVNRKGTHCYKWDSLIKEYGDNDIIPMGIADMDFLSCDIIADAIIKRAKHHVYGYSFDTLEELSDIIVKRYRDKGYKINANDVVLCTGVVHGIDAIIKQVSKPGDKIILPVPYYTPFKNLVEDNAREILACPMKIVDERYVLDLAAIENDVDEKTTMFIFCNPHNPTGRIFEHKELVEVANFCQKHNLKIINDEIHSDFALNKKFESLMNINDFTLNNCFTFSSCTKTYNLAGCKVAFGFIKDQQIRENYLKMAHINGVDAINIFGIEAIKAAYQQCYQWEEELINYIKNNMDYLAEALKDTKIIFHKPEGTYLAWLDFSNYHIDNLNQYLIEKAHVSLNDGTMYGLSQDYQRMNCALPSSLLKEAVKRIKETLEVL